MNAVQCILYSFCFISPNNTLATFHHSQYEFTEDCAYTVVEDCVHGHFSVRLEHSEDNANSTKNLILYQACSNLQLSEAGELFINSKAVLPPFRNKVFDVKSTNSTTDIWTDSGLYLQWHTNGEILVAVPTEIADYTCGVCGTFQEHNVINREEYKQLIGSSSVSSYFDVFYSFVLL